jgi:hypothetical protein
VNGASRHRSIVQCPTTWPIPLPHSISAAAAGLASIRVVEWSTLPPQQQQQQSVAAAFLLSCNPSCCSHLAPGTLILQLFVPQPCL